MINWIPINESAYNRPVLDGRPGQPRFERSASVYDVPQRLGLEFVSMIPPVAVVHVEYLSSEPIVERIVDDTMTVELGANSGRLRKATIKLESVFHGGVRAAPDVVANFIVKTLIGFLKSRTQTPRYVVQSNMARFVLGDNQQQFAASIQQNQPCLAR